MGFHGIQCHFSKKLSIIPNFLHICSTCRDYLSKIKVYKTKALFKNSWKYLEVILTKDTKSYERLAFIASERPDAQEAARLLRKRYGNHDAANADVIIALGGDGLMLEALRRHMPLIRRGLPIYGMNRGTIGFLMNDFSNENLLDRIQSAKPAIIHPLKMQAVASEGAYEELAFNEVSLFRQTRQAAHIRIIVDGRERMDRLIADGVLVSTPAGSTAYNLSAHGPVIPLGAEILALTPISAFRPRRWRGALLKAQAKVRFENLDPEKRPVSATADSREFRNIRHVNIEQDMETSLTLLFDPDQALDEKILLEQFST